MFNKFNPMIPNKGKDASGKANETLPLYPNVLPSQAGREQSIAVENRNTEYGYLEIVERHEKISQRLTNKQQKTKKCKK